MAQIKAIRLKELDDELKEKLPFEYITQNLGDLGERQEEDQTLIKRQDEVKNIIKRLEGIKPGKDNWKEFEDFCLDLIKLTFVNDFSSQPATQVTDYEDGKNKKKRRRDIILANSPLKTDSFWFELKQRDSKREKPFALGCESIVFECKNHTKRITADHVYQTFEYLDPGDRNNHPIGRLAFILTRKGSSPSANRAIKRVKEDGYYIFVITDEIIKEKWLSKYQENISVEGFFTEFIKSEAPKMG